MGHPCLGAAHNSFLDSEWWDAQGGRPGGHVLLGLSSLLFAGTA